MATSGNTLSIVAIRRVQVTPIHDMPGTFTSEGRDETTQIEYMKYCATFSYYILLCFFQMWKCIAVCTGAKNKKWSDQQLKKWNIRIVFGVHNDSAIAEVHNREPRVVSHVQCSLMAYGNEVEEKCNHHLPEQLYLTCIQSDQQLVAIAMRTGNQPAVRVWTGKMVHSGLTVETCSKTWPALSWQGCYPDHAGTHGF